MSAQENALPDTFLRTCLKTKKEVSTTSFFIIYTIQIYFAASIAACAAAKRATGKRNGEQLT